MDTKETLPRYLPGNYPDENVKAFRVGCATQHVATARDSFNILKEELNDKAAVSFRIDLIQKELDEAYAVLHKMNKNLGDNISDRLFYDCSLSKIGGPLDFNKAN
jgi:hypothetical protein